MGMAEGFETDEGVDEPVVVRKRSHRGFEIREMDHGLHRVYRWRERSVEWVYEDSFPSHNEALDYIDEVAPPEDPE